MSKDRDRDKDRFAAAYGGRADVEGLDGKAIRIGRDEYEVAGYSASPDGGIVELTLRRLDDSLV